MRSCTTREIKDFDGAAHRMCGVIPMSCKMNDSLRTVGYVTAKALSDNVVAKKGEELRGHEFHFSSAEPDGEIPRAFLFTKNRTGEKYPGGWADKNILGSYSTSTSPASRKRRTLRGNAKIPR
ncbi:MAG: hypothetical protein ACLUEQ_01745 [Cloacibacillus evryensis]